MTVRSAIAVAMAALVLGAASACSGDDDEGPRPLGSPSVSAPAASATAETPGEVPSDDPVGALEDLHFTEVVGGLPDGGSAADAAVLAYVGYTEITGRAFAAPGSVPDDDVGFFSIAGAYNQTIDYAAELADDGRSLQGAVMIRPGVTGETSGLVHIEDCMDQSAVRIHNADGSVEDIDQSDWLDIRAEVQRGPAGWQVSTFETDERTTSCDG